MRRDAGLQRLAGAEHGGVFLHGALHAVAQRRRSACRHWRCAAGRSGRGSCPRVAVDRRDRRVPRSSVLPARRAAARPKTTRSVSELEPSRLAPCTEAQAASPTAIRPGTIAIGIAAARVERFAVIVRGDAAHIVVHGRQHRDRLAREVDAGEDLGRFRDARQALVQHLGIEMVEVEEDVVLLRARRRGLRGFRWSCSGETTSREARSLALGA